MSRRVASRDRELAPRYSRASRRKGRARRDRRHETIGLWVSDDCALGNFRGASAVVGAGAGFVAAEPRPLGLLIVALEKFGRQPGRQVAETRWRPDFEKGRWNSRRDIGRGWSGGR